MSQVQTFLAPFSRLLYANRNWTIVVLCLLLAWVACYALINYWRNQRLVRELARAKSDLSTSPAGRRYASAAAAPPEPVAEGGVLPPVKGGRTYARNLGSALQKAGMTPPAQQIYSPPPHQGWPAQPNPAQPGPGMPPQASPYPPQQSPWGTPPVPSPSPWGYPGGANRSPVPGQPAPMPLYQPQPPPQMPSPAPGLYGPPPNAPFGQPSFAGPAGPAPTSPHAPSQAPPEMVPGGPSGVPPIMPQAQGAASFAAPAAAEAADQPVQESGRRGKPKRRRFNLSVLDNLEKIVQAKAAEVRGSVAPTGPAIQAASPAPVAAPTPSVPAPPEPVQPAEPLVTTPAIDQATLIEPQPEPLPLQFDSPTQGEETAPQPEAVQAEAPTDEEGTVEAASEPIASASEDEAQAQPASQPEPETTPEPAVEPEPQWRASMRNMMFGEEAARAAESAASTAESAGNEHQEAAPRDSARSGGEWTWGTMSAQHEETPAETATPAPAVEAEPVAEAPAPAEAEQITETEPVAESDPPAQPAGASVDEPPAESPAARPSAGTLVIIEDDHTAADYYSTLFRGNGYQVEVANDGVSGVDLCVRVQPQVILLDVMMPRQNGILVLQTLRASDETKNTPVVVMSNFSEPTLIKRALQLGALEYVIKTQVEGPALLEALPRWMNREKAFAAA